VNRIVTDIEISVAFDPKNAPKTTPTSVKTLALWDTGATKSVITTATVRALGLVPTGTTMVYHAGGSDQRNTYMVNMILPNHVRIPGVLVTECADLVGNFGAIVGMDIINGSDFSISNVNGITKMTFRIPSIHAVDYVSEARRIRFSGVGRNDPCPCGKLDASGKPLKFKNCCHKDTAS